MENTLVIIQAWEQRNKLIAYKRYVPLLEAYRRTMAFTKGDATKTKMLAFPFELKKVKEYFKPNSIYGEVKHAQNWYDLTPKGIELVNDLKKDLTWNDEIDILLFNQTEF